MWPFTPTFPEQGPRDVDGKEYDYVIVGGGTAGSVLASKLSEDPSVSVLVIERGPVSDTWQSRIPLISSDYTSDTSPAILDHVSDPLANRGDFEMRLVYAQQLGGSSRINSSIATRGMAGGYNDWAGRLGLTDWSWDKVEPYFRSMENAERGRDDPSRGRAGPVRIRQVRQPWDFHSLEKPFEKLGFAVTSSVNSASTPAQNYSDIENAYDDKGQRVSAYSAFLNARVANDRKGRLTICTGTVVTKLAISDDGRTVKGVHLRLARKAEGQKGGPNCYVKVRREAIVCSGCFASPVVLLHSGIGPSEVLKKHSIPCVRELPVGRAFQDHLLFGMTMQVPARESLHGLINNPLLGLWHFLLYILFGTGLLATGTVPRAAWLRTSHLDEKTMEMRPEDDDGNDTADPSLPGNVPDIELMVLSCTVLDRIVPGTNIISLMPCLTQPESTGTLELASRDPEDYAKVRFPYLDDERDVIAARKGVRFTMRVMDEFLHHSDYPHKASVLTAPSINRLPPDWEKGNTGQPKRFQPMPDPRGRVAPPSAATQAIVPRSEVEKTWDTVSDEEIDTFVRSTAIPGNHAASTCRMSLDPKDGVVDQRFKVHGMTNLRVADASALPKLPTAHTMLPVMMFGMRCADFIKEDWKGKN